MNEMRSCGFEDRVLVMALREFGRSVNKNAPQGTDHDTAGPVPLSGAKLKQRSYGELPSITNLIDGDIKYSIDFPDIYVSILKDGLELQPSNN